MNINVLNSVQFSHSVVSDSLQPHGLQHPRLLCPSPTPGAYTNSCPSSRWCHPTISSSVIPFSSTLQSFPTSGSSQMSQLFASGGQSIGFSASTTVLPMNIQDWFPLGLTGWISLQSKRLSRVFSSTTVQKHQFFGAQLYSPTLTSIHDYDHGLWYMTGKTIALTRRIFVGKVTSLLFNMLSRLGSWLFFQTSISLCPDLCVSNYTHEVCAVCISIILQYAIENIICAEKCPKLNGTAWYIFRE